LPQFAANLSMMFQEVPFLERFAAARAAGFRAVEYLFPYEHPPAAVALALTRNDLTQALFNLPPGDWARGERGVTALPGREAEFREGLALALDYAKATGCTLLHAMAGIASKGIGRDAMEATYIANLQEGAALAERAGVTLLIEPINTRDIPGYFLNTTSQALSILERVGHANVRLQLDLYHCQIMEGDLATRIRRLAGHYPHVQIAGVPDRHEPDRGEVNYRYLFDLLDEIGYAGFIGCEYRPAADTRAGLGWAKEWGIG